MSCVLPVEFPLPNDVADYESVVGGIDRPFADSDAFNREAESQRLTDESPLVPRDHSTADILDEHR